jgi:hypothetical protein
MFNYGSLYIIHLLPYGEGYMTISSTKKNYIPRGRSPEGDMIFLGGRNRHMPRTIGQYIVYYTECI